MDGKKVMLKRDVLRTWEDRASEAQARIEEEIEVEGERHRYELGIARQLLTKAQDDVPRETWQAQVGVSEMLVGQTEADPEEQQQDLALCKATIAKIRADLEAGQLEKR
jgi:hypothetical protein